MYLFTTSVVIWPGYPCVDQGQDQNMSNWGTLASTLIVNEK